MYRMHDMGAFVRVFTNRYPLLGPLVYVLSLQFFIVQFIVAGAWTRPAYSYAFNVISDLGNTSCGPYAGRTVCSPQHDLFNASLVLLGITMAIGSMLIYQEFKRTRLSFIAFWLMALGGIGTVLVGVFPENTVAPMHALGAFLALGVGNLAIVLLALAIKDARPIFRIYTLVTGLVTLTAFGLFVSGTYLGLDEGGMERLAGHPQTIWLILFGSYMTGTRVRAKRRSS